MSSRRKKPRQMGEEDGVGGLGSGRQADVIPKECIDR